MKVKGTQELIKKLRDFGEKAEKNVTDITKITAQGIASVATRNLNAYAGGDEYGKVAQSINAFPEGKMQYSISVNQLPMGAYLEFGTGIFVEVATEWKDIAWAFYVNGKGWMQPQPYLYPAYVKGREQYVKDLQSLIDNLSNKFNS